MPARLRHVSLQPANDGYVLSDPYGQGDDAIWLSRSAMAVASLFNDQPTLEALQADILEQAHARIELDQLAELARALEQAGFLDTPETRARLQAQQQAFLGGACRPMTLADRSFPRERVAFEGMIQDFLHAAGRPAARGPLGGLVLPHLELRRVPAVYGAALAAMAATPAPRRVLVVGVAHRPIGQAVAAIGLDLETPMGVLKTDRDALDALNAALPFELFNAPMAFRYEHSIEFPTALLHGIWQQGFEVLPLLVGGAGEEALKPIAAAIAGLMRSHPFFPVASVDLSHVGARFGDDPLAPATAEAVAELDRNYLEAIAGRRFEPAFHSLAVNDNPTRIDAYASVHALREVLTGSGEVLAYQLSEEPEFQSAVGAGSVAYWAAT